MPPYQETPLSELFITMPELPTHEAVMQHASSTAPARNPLHWGDRFALFGGALLVATGVLSIVLGVLV